MSSVSFLYAIYEAMANDQSSLSQMQIVDGNSALLFTKMEEQLYSYMNGSQGPLQQDENQINNYVYAYSHTTSGDKRSNYQEEITKWQSQFQKDQTTAQNDENQADSLVQNAQTQTGQDSSNLQQKTQLAQSINMIGSFLANILAQHY